ncbi:MAG TPA: hypothetical protein QF698_08660, partial [Candidatus Marinimicrobia bacterium]|nr:hypothetical protein [Candidatus Neomarinimicrobiota bacterium]
LLFCSSLIIAEDYTPEQKKDLGQKAVHEMMQKIFSEAMKANIFQFLHISKIVTRYYKYKKKQGFIRGDILTYFINYGGN